MLRIVGVERSRDPQGEFVLLQNHGVLRVCLRGHMIAHDDGLVAGNHERSYSFASEEMIPAGCFVALITGTGIEGWRRDTRGNHVYQVYWGRGDSVWARDDGAIHLLQVVHSNVRRGQGILISR